MDEKLLSTVLELARLGAVGIGAIVLLLAFFLLWRSKSVEGERAKLIGKYMTLGFVFAVTAGVLGLVPLFFQTGGPVAVRLSFSPNFASQGLSPPKVEAPDGSAIQPGQKFALDPSLTAQVVTVGVDDALKDVRNLREASAKLATTLETVKNQRDALAVQTAPDPAVAADLNATSTESRQLQEAVTQSIIVGDYGRANTLSSRLNNSVRRSARPVNDILGRR